MISGQHPWENSFAWEGPQHAGCAGEGFVSGSHDYQNVSKEEASKELGEFLVALKHGGPCQLHKCASCRIGVRRPGSWTASSSG